MSTARSTGCGYRHLPCGQVPFRRLAPATAYQLNDRELAARLSFFLWSSIPDATLLDLAAKKIFPMGAQRLTVGLDMYNLLNNNVTLAFNQTFNPALPGGYLAPTSYMNPRVFRLNAEFSW